MTGPVSVSPEEVTLLSQIMADFIEGPPGEDLYRRIGERLKQLLGDALIVVNSFDSATGTMAIKALICDEKILGTAHRLFGRDPLGLHFPLTPKSWERLVDNRLVSLGGFGELTIASLPDPIRKAIDDLLGHVDVHVMVFRNKEELFGDAIVFLPSNTAIPNPLLIETYIHGASAALQRRRAEESLRQNEAYYRGLFEHSTDLVYLLDLEANILDINSAGANLLGLPRERLLGMNVLQLFSSGSAAIVRRMIEAKLNKEKANTAYEAEMITLQGHAITVEIYSRIVFEEGHPYRIQGTARDITERRRLEKENEKIQERQIETLKQANRLKDEFLSVISHELRTPLNAILGFSSLLADGVVGPLASEQCGFLEKIMRSSDRMVQLIDDLLDVAKLRAGMLEIRPSLTRYSSLVEEAVSSLEPLAREKTLILSRKIRVDEEVPLDGPRIVQVLLNLLSNAIKFTEKGGQILIRASLENGRVVTEVQDSGIGIVTEDLAELFVPFKQLDMGLTRKIAGTGLGLSICKGIVEGHGGIIEAKSPGPGQGSTFRFELPLKR